MEGFRPPYLFIVADFCYMLRIAESKLLFIVDSASLIFFFIGLLLSFLNELFRILSALIGSFKRVKS